MEANELRIGNWVGLGNRVIQVHHLPYLIDADSDAVGYLINEVWLSEYNPIPLTEEWLINLGFVCEWDEYEGDTKEWHKGCMVFVNSDHYKIHSSWVFEPEIKYVHQLQNLYFALTGEELKTQ